MKTLYFVRPSQTLARYYRQATPSTVEYVSTVVPGKPTWEKSGEFSGPRSKSKVVAALRVEHLIPSTLEEIEKAVGGQIL